ncbi:uncharacterized protein LOC122320870 [Drosophila ficusphila]|uniref:uncharacterized protein LOC122320870 n=1 Tax=Drosophila ficusphila TaxID=30025 RepID=UPI001C8AF522|nr:uncharacterized protein LOC122320870 [Drosophila ficusphila]
MGKRQIHRYQLFFSNLSKQKTELELALKLLDWSKGFKVSAIHETHHYIYKDLVAELNLQMDREMSTIMYSLTCEEAEKLEIICPEGYYLDKVRQEHADLINNLWSARHPGSLKLVEMLITYNTNVGLYEKESGLLCAWCLRLQSGFLGALEVIQSHQRRGFGLVVAAAISKAIATDLKQDITALVNMNNNAACRVFEKLNFKLIRGEHYNWLKVDLIDFMCSNRFSGVALNLDTAASAGQYTNFPVIVKDCLAIGKQSPPCILWSQPPTASMGKRQIVITSN